MVKEIIDTVEHILDIDLDKLKKNQEEASTLSVKNIADVELKQQQQQQQQNEHLALPTENDADKLRWNFFEEISDLDNQLNATCDLQRNIGSLMNHMSSNYACNRDFENSDTVLVPTTTISRKTHGYALSATDITADIFPQPDVIFEPKKQQQQQNYNSFQFTSPTSTFKRKKLQQQQRESEQDKPNKHILNNNNNSSNNKNSNQKSLSPILNSNTVTLFATNNNPQSCSTLKPSNQQAHNEALLGANTMISCSLGVIIGKVDKTVATTTTTTTGTAKNTKKGDTTINGRKLNSTIGRLPDNGSTITCDDTKPVNGNQCITATTTRRYHNNSRRGMGTSLTEGVGSAASRSESSKASVTAKTVGGGFVESMDTNLSLFGWRKKCLYAILVLLMLLITINLMLTFWILQVMEFSTEGMGLLKIIPGGIQLSGQTIIMDMLRASTIRSRHGQPIAIESSRNFSINTRDSNGMLENHLYLGHDKLECLATEFRINDTTGRNLFSVNRNEVTIGAHALRIDGEGGAVFRESVQTPHVRAEPGRELRFESPTRQLEVTAAKDINLQSRAGGIELSALEDVKLSALDGSLRLESSKILMPNLRTAQPPLPGTAQNREHLHRVFQLCACANGKLFLAAPHSICAGDDSTVCR